MNPNSTYAVIDGNNVVVYGYSNGNPTWIRISWPGIAAAFQTGRVNFQNLSDGSWQTMIMGSGAPPAGTFTYPVPAPPASAQNAVTGSQGQLAVYQGGFVPGSGQVAAPSQVSYQPAAGVPGQSSPYGSQGGGYIQGPGAGVSTALIAQLLTGQQTSAAAGAMMAQANTDAQAAAAAADLAPALASMQAGVAMAIGIQATTGQAALLSSPNGLLFMLLGSQGVQQLSQLITQATKAFDTSGASAATLGLAWDNFAKGIASVLTSVQQNGLLASLAGGGGGGVGIGALLGIMMGQQATAAFSQAISTNPPSTTLPTTKVNVQAFNTAFGTMLAALNTNQLLMALVPSS